MMNLPDFFCHQKLVFVIGENNVSSCFGSTAAEVPSFMDEWCHFSFFESLKPVSLFPL